MIKNMYKRLRNWAWRKIFGEFPNKYYLKNAIEGEHSDILATLFLLLLERKLKHILNILMKISFTQPGSKFRFHTSPVFKL